MTEENKKELIALTDYMPVNRGAWNKYTSNLLDYVEDLLAEQEKKHQMDLTAYMLTIHSFQKVIDEMKIKHKQEMKEVIDEACTKCYRAGSFTRRNNIIQDELLKKYNLV